MRQSVCNAGASNAGRSLCIQISRERCYPLPIYWYHSKGNELRYNFATDSFYMVIFTLDKLNISHISTSGLADLESVSRDAYLTMKVSTKFEVDTTIGCQIIALLLLIRYVTLWPWPCDLLTLVSGHKWRVTWSILHQVWRSYGYPFLSYKFWHHP